MVNKKLFRRSLSNNDLWDMVNRSPSQRRLFDSRDTADALVTLENQVLGRSRSWSTSLNSRIHDTSELSQTVRDASPYKLTEWSHGDQSRIANKMSPTPYRKIDIERLNQDGFWASDWSPQGRLDAKSRLRESVEDGRREIQASLEHDEIVKRKVVHQCGTKVFADSKRPMTEKMVEGVVHRCDSQVRSSPHQKIVRFYHVGSTMPRT